VDIEMSTVDETTSSAGVERSSPLVASAPDPTSAHPGETAAASPPKAESDAARQLAKVAGLDFVDLDRYPLNAAATALLPLSVARRRHALVVGWKYGTPVVAVAEPDNVLGMDDIKTMIGREVHTVVSCPSQIEKFIDLLYKPQIAEEQARSSTSAPPTGSRSSGERHRGPGDPAASGTHRGPDSRSPSDRQRPPSTEDSAPPPVAASRQAPSPGATPVSAPTPPRTDEYPSTPGAPPPRTEEKDEETVMSQSLLSEEEMGQVLEGLGLGSTAREAPPVGPLSGQDDSVPDGPSGPPPARRQRRGAGSLSSHENLAEVLVSQGQVTKEEMEAAKREQSSTGRPLGEILAELGLVSEEDLVQAMAAEMGLPYVNLNEHQIDQQAVGLLTETLARRHRVLAIGWEGDTPVVAMANPSDVFALDDLRTVLGRELAVVMCSGTQIDQYIARLYRHDQETTLAAKNAAQQTLAADVTQTLEVTDLHATVEDAPIVKYVNLILRQALSERASDIHIEPTANDLRVRFRIDGVLHDAARSPKEIQGGVTTRLKVMADLDIAEHRVTQDGRISLNAGNRQIDLRLATLPTVHGEKIVMRVLDKSNAMLDLGDLGFLPDVLSRYERSYKKPYGTILVTGPTGSGKSTTLYATLNILNSPERNLITVEDPVEYQLRGINQVQVNPKAGLTFAGALRSILRSDPDIVLVGEIRDRETAIIAIEAALTGHLVLSSLHTNDAAGTPMRLVEMGVEPFLVGSSLDCVLAQRLARQLCEECSENYQPSKEDLEIFSFSDADAPSSGAPHFRRAVGCQACSHTGYRGRIAIHESLVVTEEIERAVISRATSDEIQSLAVARGMVPLRHDGLRKAALGLTTLDEVARVVV
jgi:type IV pilus assembly protein PilB